MQPFTRRQAAALTAAAFPLRAQKPPTVIVRSGWQSVNIGDITHTPGMLAVLEKNWPGARLILWPGEIERGVEPMLLRRFPRLLIVKGAVDKGGGPDNPELAAAFREADLLIHSSAPSVTSPAQVECWRRTTGKPYGFFGIGVTLAGEAASARLDGRIRSLFTGAAFVFTRETNSLKNLETAAIEGPKKGFAPDSTFSFDILDEEKGEAFCREHNLEKGKFIAIVPRLRITPYHRIRHPSTYGPEEAERRDRINAQHAETDHAKLREAAIQWVRRTGGKVLFCPEMTYELEIIGPLLYDPLPPDVKAKAVPRKTYWLPDEAASVYKRAAAVVSFECHSPIIAATVGTPALYVHQPEDGIKGRMYPDLGLGANYFEVEQATGAQIAARVLEIGRKSAAARRETAAAAALARRLQAAAMRTVRGALRRG